MKLVAYFLGAVAVIGGLVFGVIGFLMPRRYDLAGASALQITQVYAEAQYYILISIAAFALAIVFTVAGNGYVE